MHNYCSPSLRVDPSEPAPKNSFCLPGEADETGVMVRSLLSGSSGALQQPL